MKTLNKLSDILSGKCKYFCEYNMLQNALRQQSVNFDMLWSQYTTINVVESYIINIGRHAIADKNVNSSIKMCWLLKIQNPFYQPYCKKMFNFPKENWTSIYISRIKNIYDKKICEFDSKLLNNILRCNSYLHQCKLRPKTVVITVHTKQRILNSLFLNVAMWKKYD